MNFVFLMDPLGQIKADKDTSFCLMQGAQKKNHLIYFLPEGGITLHEGLLHFHVTQIQVGEDKNHPFRIIKETILHQEDVDIVWIRTDPPFDYPYLLNSWLLDMLPDYIPVINDPTGIRTVNEKIWATQFTSIIPPTMVTSNHREILDFIKQHHDVIAKPTDGFGGQSVFRIKAGDLNQPVILETLSCHYSRKIVLQPYLTSAEKGDKRILLLNGEPLGAVLRLHNKIDHRNNFFSGGAPLSASINSRDEEIVSILKPHLQKLGLYFVGIDIIGEYLIEVNVTSPTCLQEMNYLNNVHLEDNVIEFAQKLIADCKSGVKINHQ